LLLKELGLLNSLWGIIIPPAATPTGVFLARQYIQTIPNSYYRGGTDGWRKRIAAFF